MLCLYKIKILVYNDDNNIMLIFNYMLKMVLFFFIKIEYDFDKKRRYEMKVWKIVYIGFVENKYKVL